MILKSSLTHTTSLPLSVLLQNQSLNGIIKQTSVIELSAQLLDLNGHLQSSIVLSVSVATINQRTSFYSMFLHFLESRSGSWVSFVIFSSVFHLLRVTVFRGEATKYEVINYVTLLSSHVFAMDLPRRHADLTY